MRIVHIVESFGGGVYSYFKDLALFMSQQKNIETIIIYSNRRKEVSEEQIYNDFPKNIKLISVDMERELKPFKDLQSTFKIRKLLKDIKPDVVHLHSSKAGVIGRWATTLIGKRNHVYYTPHGYSFLRLDISPLKRKMFYGIEKLTQLVFGGTTIACGDTEYKIAKKIGKSTLVRNGIDIKNITKHYKIKTSKNTKLTIGIVGRIVFPRAPWLFNEIANKFPIYDFVWIGDGELNHLLTAKNIKITGWCTSQEEIFAHLNNLDIYIQTSLWEGLPIAVLEAMAFKKPIIATNVIGNKDIVKQQFNGFLFNDIKELHEIFTKLEDINAINELGKNAQLDILEYYNMEKNFNHLLSIYKGNLTP